MPGIQEESYAYENSHDGDFDINRSTVDRRNTLDGRQSNLLFDSLLEDQKQEKS